MKHISQTEKIAEYEIEKKDIIDFLKNSEEVIIDMLNDEK